MKKIAIVDPASYSLPYDYHYIKELSKTFLVDFYFSNTKYNYHLVNKLKNNKNIKLLEYNISNGSKFKGLLNYIKMLKDIHLNENEYHYIHFFWSIFFIFEYLFFKVSTKKVLFTFHNDVPHNNKNKVFFPYQIIHNSVYKSVFVSEFTKNRFKENYNIKKPICLVQHGIMKNNEIIIKEEKGNSTLVFWGLVKEYKGVDIFLNDEINFNIEILGKWDSSLFELRDNLNKKENILINNRFLSEIELNDLLERKVVFILPYKNATQSGVLYTLLAHEKIFISSNVGETYQFLKRHDLESLSFERNDIQSMINSYKYALNNYEEIKSKLKKIKYLYSWENTMKSISEIYK